MPRVTVSKENTATVDLHYNDLGSGKPIVLIHGWPLSGASWERQLQPLLDAGHRVITYDRRGFGDSAQPSTGYDYDTLAADLDALMTKLDLRDATLVGFSMGGGEVARYLGKHGSERVSKAVFISAITPALLKAPDNEEGVEREVFEGMKQAIVDDRPAFLTKFLKDFYNVDNFGGREISDEAVRLSWTIATRASPIATVKCVDAWLEDFRDDIKDIRVPTLVIHGTGDRIVPFESSGERMTGLLENGKLVKIDGAPHGLNWTHADDMNRALLDFLGAKTPGTKMRKTA